MKTSKRKIFGTHFSCFFSSLKTLESHSSDYFWVAHCMALHRIITYFISSLAHLLIARLGQRWIAISTSFSAFNMRRMACVCVCLAIAISMNLIFLWVSSSFLSWQTQLHIVIFTSFMHTKMRISCVCGYDENDMCWQVK